MSKLASLDVIQLQARLLRRTLRRSRQLINTHQPSLEHSPVFFANSFPKSGTHLLTQILKGFTSIGPAIDSGLPAIVTFDGHTGHKRSEDEILKDLKRLLPGDIAYGHLHASSELLSLLSQDIFATYFIIRDPRDVAVSHVHYVTEMEFNHAHHQYYQEVLDNFDQRLQASIEGIQSSRSRVKLPNIRKRFEPYIAWLDCPEILTIHFEDLINQKEKTLEMVLDHAIQHNFTPVYSQQQAIQILSQSINPQLSPTFRSGKIGSWQTSFTENHKQAFKNTAGDLLIHLGYEDNLNW